MWRIWLLVALARSQVEISLESGWKGYSENSLKQELSEYFAEIGYFWEFISQDLTAPLENLIEANSRNALEKKVIYSSLYNREFSPRLEFYSSLELSEKAICSPFFVINSVVTCSLDAKLAEGKVPIENNFDHVLYPREGSLIAYVNIASGSFLKLHSEIIAFTEEHDLSYVIRHTDTRSESRETLEKLGGYSGSVTQIFENSGKSKNKLEDFDGKLLSQILIQYLQSLDSFPVVLHTVRNLPQILPDLADSRVKSEIKKVSEEKNILTINGFNVVPNFFSALKYLREEAVPFTLIMSKGFNYPIAHSLFLKMKNDIQNPRYDDKIIIGNPMITSIPSRYIQVSANVPSLSYGDSIKANCFIYVVLGQDDLNLAQLALKAKTDYASSFVQVKFIFNFHDLTENWQPVLCKIIGKNCEKSYMQDQLHKSSQMVKSQNLCGSCVIVNSRVIDSRYFVSSKDFLIAYQTENRRINIDELKNVISDKSVLEKMIHIMLRYAKNFGQNPAYQALDYNGEQKQTAIYPPSSKESFFIVKIQADVTSYKLMEILEVASFMQKLGAEIKISYVWSVDWKFPARTYTRFLIKESFTDTFVINLKDNSFIYSFSLNTPDHWITKVSDSTFNLNYFEVVPKRTVNYRLTNLILKGTTSVLIKNEIKQPSYFGLALTRNNEQISESITVPATGYFQFKASPGLFEIKFISNDLFEILRGKTVTVRSLLGENHELLMTERLENKDTINVFLHASGLESERCVKMLIKSIVEHTTSKVKFFILEDTLLTPNLLTSIELLSSHFHFEYQFVSYTWPQWMFELKDITRINMVYRTVLLDILLPGTINKVIVITPNAYFRGDIKEIWNSNLNNNIFGMFPLTGFVSEWWQKHLKGKPFASGYLILVDLHRLRESQVGTKLRKTYNLFIPDKNNLVVLDQDILNFISTENAITILPSTWLAVSWEVDSLVKDYLLVVYDFFSQSLTSIIPTWQEEEESLLELELTLLEG